MWNNLGLLDAVQDILSILQTINPNEPLTGKPTFKKIDIWNDQLRFMKDGTGYTFPTPAIFLEMKPSESKILGMGINLIDYDVIFHIVDAQLNNTNLLDRNIKVFTLRNQAKDKFQLFQPTQMGQLFFIKDEQDFSHDMEYHYKITFRGALLDTWGNDFPTVGSASTPLTISYTHSLY